MIAPARQSHAFMAHLRVTWIERAWMRHLCRRGMSRKRIARGFGRNASTVEAHCRGIEARRSRYRTYLEERAAAKAHRDAAKAAGVCICGPLSGAVSKRGTEHGPVVAGGRCARCVEVRRRTA